MKKWANKSRFIARRRRDGLYGQQQLLLLQRRRWAEMEAAGRILPQHFAAATAAASASPSRSTCWRHLGRRCLSISARQATKKVFIRTKTKLMPTPSQTQREEVAGMMNVEPTTKANTSDNDVTKMDRPLREGE